MLTNLLLANCVGKEIVYDAHFVEIPVMLFDLMYRNKFPLRIAQDRRLNLLLTEKSILSNQFIMIMMKRIRHI